MAYSKTTWSSGDTITAAKLNNMESGIADNADDITTINQSLSDKTDRVYYGDSATVDSMLSDLAAKANLRAINISCAGATAQFLTNSTSSGIWSGTIYRNGTSYGYFLFSYGSSYIYYGRITDGEITTLRRLAGDSVSLNSLNATAENT